MRLSEQDIQEINSKVDTWNEGIFREPAWIPSEIKELVIYQRFETGGVTGGSCWDDSSPRGYSVEERPPFKVLDEVLMKICPDLSYSKFKEIEALINVLGETDWEYYGNCTNYEVRYVVLSELYKLLGL